MAYMMAIYFLLMQAALTGVPNPAQTVQGNIAYQKAYIEQGILPGQEKKIAQKSTGKNTLSKYADR